MNELGKKDNLQVNGEQSPILCVTENSSNTSISETCAVQDSEPQAKVKKGKTKPEHNFYVKRANSMRYKTWNYFAIFVALSVFIAALAFVLLSGPSYNLLKRMEITDSMATIKEYLPNIQENADKIKALADESNSELFIFSEVSGMIDYTIIFSCNPFMTDSDSVPTPNRSQVTAINEMFAEWKTTEQITMRTFSERDKPVEEMNFLICLDCCTIDDVNYIITITTSLLSQVGSQRIMIVQVFVLLFSILVLAIATSWTLSQRLSNPIVKMSVSARKLAQGNYNVTFEGNGYNEIDELAETLNYATAQLAHTQQMRKDIVANVSHDLKTPLTLIKSYAEMLRDFPDASAEKRAERLEVIIKETDRVNQLVSEMTRLSLSETGNMVLKKEVFNLSELIESVAESFSVNAELQKGVFTTNIQNGISVYADKSQISQVVYNFVANAFNYSGEDKKIRLELKQTQNTVRFDCFDNGCGLTEDERNKVWDRYYRASSTYARGNGTGLGLSIAKSILQLHDAKYGVNSVLGQGSDFYFELPIDLPETGDDTQ